MPDGMGRGERDMFKGYNKKGKTKPGFTDLHEGGK